MGKGRTKSRKRSIPKWFSDVLRYADRVASDALPVSPQVAGVAKRFIRWYESKRYELRLAEVERASRLFGMMRHVRGPRANEPFILAPWQAFVVTNLFGWWADDRRVIRRAFISVARKNGKSTFAAGLTLKALLADGEAGPQVVCVATSRDQARIVFSEACAMMRGPLSEFAYSYRSELRCPGNDGRMWAASADSARLWGYSLSCAIVDELHAFKDRRIWDAVLTSMVARSNPMLIAISTAGEDEAMLFDELRTAAEVANDSEDMDAFFGFDCYVPDDADVDDPANWKLANPSLGVTVTLDDLAEVRAACRSPAAVAAFRRYHLNQTVSGAWHWVPLEVWRASDISALPDLSGKECVIGVDLASSRDLSAIVLAFPSDDDRVYVAHKAFTCSFAVERGNRARLYSRLASAGDLIVTEGDTIDEAAIRNEITEAVQKYAVRAIYYDRALATGLVQRLVQDGVPESLLVAHPMTAAAVDPLLRETERLIYERKLQHLRSEVFEYCLMNAVVETNSYGLRRLSKRKSEGPIDLVTALVLAVGNQSTRTKAASVGILWL